MENTNHCQSYGMPMEKPDDFGKNTDGGKNQDYCGHCFPNGAFTNPDETMEEKIESCVPFIVEAGECPDADSARKMLQEFLPTLKRWKAA